MQQIKMNTDASLWAANASKTMSLKWIVAIQLYLMPEPSAGWVGDTLLELIHTAD